MITASFEFNSDQCMTSPSVFLFSMSLHSYLPTSILFEFVCLGSLAWDIAIGTCARGLGLTTSAWKLVLETAHKVFLDFISSLLNDGGQMTLIMPLQAHFEHSCVLRLDCFRNVSGRAVYGFCLLLAIPHRSRFIVRVGAGIICQMDRLLSSN